MVLVAVGQHDRLDVVDPPAQVGEVGQDEVDAEHLGGREHQAGVDDDDPAVVLDDGHVLADLPEPAERQDPQLFPAHPTTSSPAPSSAARTTSRWPSSSGTIGSRIRSEQMPSICSAPFSGIGLPVTANAS